MNEIAVVDKGADWRRLKALVLDSVVLQSRGCVSRPRILGAIASLLLNAIALRALAAFFAKPTIQFAKPTIQKGASPGVIKAA